MSSQEESMLTVPMNVSYLSHREIKIRNDVTYFVRVNITGPVVLETSENKYLESVICEVYVQKGECQSDAPEDLRRCAARRIEQLAKEAHAKAVRETL
jgi:hypothetical protein